MAQKNWLDFPQIKAPSPDGAGTWLCSISKNFIDRNVLLSRKTPIFQLWAHVVGELPPINNAGTIRPAPDLLTLDKARACFKGVNRPYNNEKDGASVLVYVLEPSVSLAYQSSLACAARAVTVPEDTVLTVQVCPVTALHGDQEGIQGIVTRLEFVSSVGAGPALPEAHDDRYNKLLWKR